jgi:hypothetical protein
MERQRFEAPRASRWPFAVAAVLVVFAVAAVWLLRPAPGPESADSSPRELITDDTSPATPANTPTDTSPDASPGAAEQAASEPAEAGLSAMDAIGSAGMALGAGGAGGSGDSATTESLLEQADEAFDSGALFQALPLYKEVAVRLQGEINQTPEGPERDELAAQLENVKALVRDSEEGLRASGGVEVPDLATRTPHTPPAPGQTLDLTIEELGNFPYDDEAGGVPADVEALDGSQIRMSGYMVPGFQTDSIKQFTLVTSVYECCFGQPPGVEHAINVVLPEGRAVTFTYGEVQVTGTLRVEEERRDGFVVNLFTIEDVTSVRATGRQ